MTTVEDKKIELVDPRVEDHLDEDKPIRGQKYVLLSFVSPEDVIENKEVVFFSKFIESFSNNVRDMFKSIKDKYPETSDVIDNLSENHKYVLDPADLNEQYNFFKSVHGQDLEYIIHHLGLDKGQVFLSRHKVNPEHLAVMYNIADCTISVSDAEGFGLANLESLACETPIIVTMTGGLQEQVTDGERWFGIGMEPTSKAVIGSQEIPFIYEDRLSEEVVVDALRKIYNMTKEERAELGNAGREHILKNYSPEKYAKEWEELFDRVVEQHGSWDTRKGYKAWELIEV